MQRTRLKATLSTLGAVALLAAPVSPASAVLRDAELVSVNSDEEQPAFGVLPTSYASEDGRFVAFSTGAPNMGGVMAPGQQWGAPIYVRDRVEGTTTLVSTDAAGFGVGAELVDFSADGRYVLMWTSAALVPGDTDDSSDFYVRDIVAGDNRLASQGDGWPQIVQTSPFATMSDDGNKVAFVAYVPGSTARERSGERRRDSYDVWVRNLATSSTELVSVSRAGKLVGGRLPRISGNGRFVAFDSRSANLVRHDTNGRRDVFVRDLSKGRTERVSVSSSGRQSNGGVGNGMRISVTGRYVAFTSLATNLVRRDTNRAADAFVHDRKRDVTRRVSVGSRGQQAPRLAGLDEMSASGRYVSFVTTSHLGGPRRGKTSYDIYVNDRVTQRTRYLTESETNMKWTLSDRGWAAFTTDKQLVAEDGSERSTDVYVAWFT